MELHPVWRVWAFCVILASASAMTEMTSNKTGFVWLEEDSVTLHCTTQIPNAYIFWNLDGQPLPGDIHYAIFSGKLHKQSTLIISPVCKNDRGNFTCTASNGTTTEVSNGLSLNLALPSATSSIVCGAEHVRGSIQFICSWSGGQPAANINLTFNGTVQSGQNVVTKTVKIGNAVQQSELICQGDQAGRKSECKATFEQPRFIDHSSRAVTTVREGKNATFTAALAPNPLQPQLSWFHLNPEPVPININNERFKVDSNSSHSTLHITNATSNEVGTYEFKASNTMGSKSFLFSLQITPIVSAGTSNGLSSGMITNLVTVVVAGLSLIRFEVPF